MNQKDIKQLNTLYKTVIVESRDDSGPPYIKVDYEGTKYYYKDREMTILHREDGPAIEYANGDKYWYQNGKRHRLDGPAIEYPDGYKAWYQNGKLHREDGPAIEDANGNKEWYQNGELHREDGPAVEDADGNKYWYQNGKIHREDGPAVEYANGRKAWYINGKELTEKEFKAYLANKAYKASHSETTDFEAFD